MKKLGLLTLFLLLTLLFLNTRGVSARDGGVEIGLDGLSPAAQKAINNMITVRSEVKGQLEEAMARFDTLKETYIQTCGTGRSNDEGCQKQFNQAIDAYTDVARTIAGFLKKYNENSQMVVDELEPQIERVAYENSPSDLNEDIINKYEEGSYGYEDEFANAIKNAFGLDEGKTEYELLSSSYLQHKKEYKEYALLLRQLKGKIREASRLRVLGPIINAETQGELAKMTGLIFGAKPTYREPHQIKRTSVLR